MERIRFSSLLPSFLFASAIALRGVAVGVNWGQIASHRLPPEMVVTMLVANGFDKVKMLFDADPDTLSALSVTKIEVMFAIPNSMLLDIAADPIDPADWVGENVTSYVCSGRVNIRRKTGFLDMPVIVGEVGWPTDGHKKTNADLAKACN
ncbi:Glucan endo-1,3-beta-glucosidase 8 [Platanthera guangdongensis]|uniref:Glucan endo-1,3-beta-glucosidase 8 n=1 Tax=Platanthera guangdongensis TaxID=2320717 RepID=A0ABR2LG29_9ASPA